MFLIILQKEISCLANTNPPSALKYELLIPLREFNSHRLHTTNVGSQQQQQHGETL